MPDEFHSNLFWPRYNRYSMPVTRSRNGLYGADLDQTGTARFLFGEDDSGDARLGQGVRDETFPTLVRREDHMVCTYFALLCYSYFAVGLLSSVLLFHCRFGWLP